MAGNMDAAPKPALVLWAERLGVVGGCVSLAMGALVSVSVLSRWLIDQSVPGDFEFVQMGTAVSVFFFLPACQAHRGNILVDSFTGSLSETARNRLDAFWDVIYGLVMAFLAVCMVDGTLEAFRSKTGTMVLQLPLWPALLVSTLMLFFLAALCFWTARMLARTGR